jgi:hypothetical protein
MYFLQLKLNGFRKNICSNYVNFFSKKAAYQGNRLYNKTTNEIKIEQIFSFGVTSVSKY